MYVASAWHHVSEMALAVSNRGRVIRDMWHVICVIIKRKATRAEAAVRPVPGKIGPRQSGVTARGGPGEGEAAIIAAAAASVGKACV